MSRRIFIAPAVTQFKRKAMGMWGLPTTTTQLSEGENTPPMGFASQWTLLKLGRGGKQYVILQSRSRQNEISPGETHGSWMATPPRLSESYLPTPKVLASNFVRTGLIIYVLKNVHRLKKKSRHLYQATGILFVYVFSIFICNVNTDLIQNEYWNAEHWAKWYTAWALYKKHLNHIMILCR